MGEAVAKIQTDVLAHFKPYEHFCKCLLDAYAIVDGSGKVLKCNPLFSQLVGLRTRQILKAESFDDLLQLDLSGTPLSIKNILSNNTPTRIDEVSGRSKEQEDLNLIIGVYPFLQGEVVLGSFILIRDVTAETNLQDKYFDKATQSITDSLTGLYNRTYFSDFMSTQMSHLENLPVDAGQRIVSVIMIDIDHFKKINDTYGHQAGDYVLKVVAQILKRTFRKTDIVCRYGGEEFLAILPGTELSGACIAAEKLRVAIEGYMFNYEGTEIPVTISSGVAQVVVGKEKGDETIARADQALYKSKDSGRNQVSVHTGDDINPFRRSST